MKLTLCRLGCVTSSILVLLSAQAAPALVFHVMPTYPQIAQSARVTGLVRVEGTVGIDGRVTNVRVLRSIPLLDQAAIDAVRQWRFTPSSDKPANITATVHFSLNDPSLYPRPATYAQPLPSWIPANFAFVYTYQCRETNVEIDSIARTVTNTTGPPVTAPRFTFGFEVDQAAEVFVTLVAAGFYEPSLESRRTSQEVAPVEPGIQQSGDQIVVRVVAQAPGLDAQINFGGKQPARQFLHTLRVRRADRWTELHWYEPLAPRRSEPDKSLIAAGKRIRALVKANLTDARMRPVCL